MSRSDIWSLVPDKRANPRPSVQPASVQSQSGSESQGDGNRAASNASNMKKKLDEMMLNNRHQELMSKVDLMLSLVKQNSNEISVIKGRVDSIGNELNAIRSLSQAQTVAMQALAQSQQQSQPQSQPHSYSYPKKQRQSTTLNSIYKDDCDFIGNRDCDKSLCAHRDEEFNADDEDEDDSISVSAYLRERGAVLGSTDCDEEGCGSGDETNELYFMSGPMLGTGRLTKAAVRAHEESLSNRDARKEEEARTWAEAETGALLGDESDHGVDNSQFAQLSSDWICNEDSFDDSAHHNWGKRRRTN